MVSPNAAGALCSMIATKTIKLSAGIVLAAPSAMPSAAAWITSPSVVENADLERVAGGGEAGEVLVSSASE